MNKFKQESACVKCGDRNASTVYCAAASFGSLIVGDVIWRTCGRCGFYWYEKPLDGDTTQVVTKPDPMLEGNERKIS